MQRSAKIGLIASMLIFGTIGMFVKYIPLPSSVIAMVRGFVGMLFLLGVMAIGRKHFSKEQVKQNIFWLCLSGAAIGINWILLFESYRYTTVATATLCYYLAPTLAVLGSAVFFGEKLTAKKALCAVAALLGMVGVSGVIGGGDGDPRGVALGLGAAVFYSAVILLNKKTGAVPALERTAIQLGASAVVMLLYGALAGDLQGLRPSVNTVLLLAVVGIVHTGITYFLYFGAVGKLSAQSVAVFSYIDPVTAVALSALLLREPLGILSILGAVLILGSALISELPEPKKHR